MTWVNWVMIAVLSLSSVGGVLAAESTGHEGPVASSVADQPRNGAPTVAGIDTSFVVDSLSGIVAVASVSSHNLALHNDGTVWEWRTYRQAPPDGMTHTPAVLVPGVRDIIAVARGDAHRLAVDTDGTVWAWGENWAGQLGDGTHQRRLAPTPVIALRNVVAIAAGGAHSLALDVDGTVYQWGQGTQGTTLGDGRDSQPSPTAGLPRVIAIAATDRHSLAVDAAGEVWAWDHGALDGDGDWPQTVTVPARVPGLAEVVTVAAGRGQHLAVKADGTVWAWGALARQAPTPVAGLADVVAVAVGEQHQAALTAQGAVWNWGPMWSCGGQGAVVATAELTQVMGPSDTVGLAAGHCYTLAFDRDGIVSSMSVPQTTTAVFAPRASRRTTSLYANS